MSDTIATLNFDLDTYEGERKLKECLDAPAFKAAFQELDNWLRELGKYHDVFNIEVSEVRERIAFVAEGHGIDIWED
jgi:hypothetical protein